MKYDACSIDLMKKLIQSNELVAVQGEIDLYTLLKKVVLTYRYLKGGTQHITEHFQFTYAKCKHMGCKKASANLKADADEWFAARKGVEFSFLFTHYTRQPARFPDMQSSFLELKCGTPYLPVFSRLRLENIVGLHKCVRTLYDDNIIPKGDSLSQFLFEA